MPNTPQFRALRPASQLASAVKRSNKKTGGRAEVTLRHLLWECGLRYRKSGCGLPGKPDIVFIRDRVAVFVDGDFWHGRDWPSRRAALARGANAFYWIAKIEYNRVRDDLTNARLATLGWTVLRLWETDVLRDPVAAVATVEKHLSQLG